MSKCNIQCRMYLSKCNIQGRIYLSNWLCVNVNIGKGVNYIVSYAVTMVIIYCAMDEDCLTSVSCVL